MCVGLDMESEDTWDTGEVMSQSDLCVSYVNCFGNSISLFMPTKLFQFEFVFQGSLLTTVLHWFSIYSTRPSSLSEPEAYISHNAPRPLTVLLYFCNVTLYVGGRCSFTSLEYFYNTCRTSACVEMWSLSSFILMMLPSFLVFHFLFIFLWYLYYSSGIFILCVCVCVYFTVWVLKSCSCRFVRLEQRECLSAAVEKWFSPVHSFTSRSIHTHTHTSTTAKWW